MKSLTRILFAVSILLASSAGAVDINGVALNSQPTIATLHEKLGVAIVPGVFLTAGVYSGSLRIAGCPVISKIKADSESRIVQMTIEFPPSCFDDLASAAILKWGKPTKSGDFTLSNGFGAVVQAHEHDWRTDDGALIALVNVDPILTNNLRLQMGSLTIQDTPKVASSAPL